METKSTHGGAREGAGRKLGSITSDRTAQFTKRITPTEKLQLEEYLQQLRATKQ